MSSQPTTTKPPITAREKPRDTGKSRLAVLDGKQRRHLRSLAHDLQPVLRVGKAGLSKALLEELDRTLETHELVKIRLLRECPTELDELSQEVENSLAAATVGAVGKVVVLYRARIKKPSISLSGAKRGPETPNKVESSRRGNAKRPVRAKPKTAPTKTAPLAGRTGRKPQTHATKSPRKRSDWE